MGEKKAARTKSFLRLKKIYISSRVVEKEWVSSSWLPVLFYTWRLLFGMDKFRDATLVVLFFLSLPFDQTANGRRRFSPRVNWEGFIRGAEIATTFSKESNNNLIQKSRWDTGTERQLLSPKKPKMRPRENARKIWHETIIHRCVWLEK